MNRKIEVHSSIPSDQEMPVQGGYGLYEGGSHIGEARLEAGDALDEFSQGGHHGLDILVGHRHLI